MARVYQTKGDDKRDMNLTVKLSAQELDAVRKAAQRMGHTSSSWAWFILTKEAKRQLAIQAAL